MSELNLPTPDGFLETAAKLVLGPITLRRIFLLLTRLHFSDSAHYGDLEENFKSFVWAQDPNKRKLFVDYDFHYDPANVEQRPAIFVGVSDFKYRRVALDNFRKVVEDNSGVHNAYVGETSIILRHISMTPDESLGLAELSANFYMGIRKMLLERMSLHQFDVAELLQTRTFLREPQQADQQFRVDLIMRLSYIHDWVTLRESHRIKTVSFTSAVQGYSQPLTTR